MLVNHISVNDRDTMSQQKGLILAGLACHRSRTVETTQELLSRLCTIEEMENEWKACCSVHKPPRATVMVEIQRLRGIYKIASEGDRNKIEKMAKYLNESINLGMEGFELTKMVQDVLL